MSDGRKLAQLMIKAGQPKESQTVDMVIGKVTSINPLKVKVGKIELTKTFLIVGALCTETIIKIPVDSGNEHKHIIPAHTTSSGDDGHTHQIPAWETKTALPDIVLWRGLKVGDTVYMIKMAKGQKYYIMQREEGITNDS